MSDPSLLNIPYRFKPGTLYSQIPDSGLGDFVVSRSASNAATRVNASGFIETVADNVPRLDYPIGGIAAGCPSLLVEPSAQNLVTNSEAWNIGWGAVNATINLGIDTSATRDPYNTNVADTMFETAVNNTHIIFRDFSVTNGATYTFSFFVKSIASRNVQILGSVDFPSNTAQVNLSTLAITGAGASTCRVQDYGNGWRRISQTFTATGTNGRIIIYSLNGTVPNFLGSVTDGLYVFGAQLETGSLATSYIPTTTTPITRGAEVVEKTGLSGLIGQTEGTLYIECENVSAANDVFYLNKDSSNTVRITKDASNVFTGQIRASGIVTSFVGASGVTGMVKIAIAYKSGDSAMYLNSLQVGTTSSSAITFSAALAKVTLSDSAFFVGKSPTRIRATALFPTRLTNSELQALTT